ncbi:LamG-like jellyroll fold domain-containing protein [Micromonospora sp. BQ11]|uniref:LamG-like jellyroll fold domain-containing protein n=1 Tax=Micromonospora sp. BQ11 TaxID=3452212 RepID=UPI003F898937
MSFGLRRVFDRSDRPAPRRHLLSATLLRPAVAAAMVGVLALNLGGSGVNGLSTGQYGQSGRDGAGRGTAAGDRPGQAWGSAAGRGQVAKGKPNRDLPKSLRGQYPLHRLPQEATPRANKATVAKPPADTAKGYDRATSRERPAERDERKRVYDNADGSQTTEISTAPVNYKRPDGSWAPIDPTLVPAADGPGWRNTADAVETRLADRADAAELVRLTFTGGAQFGFRLADAGAVTGQATAQGVTYPRVRPDVDLRLEPRPGGVKETLVLHSAQAPTSYVFPLALRDLTAKLVDGQVVLTDKAGTQRAVIPPGYMVDAGAGSDGPATSTGVTYHLDTVGGQPALRVTLDRAWLNDPARTYPVEVDPTVGPPVTGLGADSSMYVHGSSSTTGGQELLVGRSNGSNAAAYLKFGGLSQLQNHTIHGVALSVVNYDAASCKPRAVTVHPVTGAWSAGTGYSYPGPAVGSSLASRSFAHGYIAFGQSQSSCPAAGEAFDLGVAGRNLVQRWVKGEQANHGLSLRASTTDSTAWKRFAGTGTANPPKLYVTHSPYNATYAIPKPSPEPPVLRNQDGKVKVTVTNLGAEAWTPANYYLAYRVYNAQTGVAVTQQRAASLPTTLARGAKVTLDATVKRLEPGAYFLDFTMVRTGGVVFTDHQVPPGRIVLQVFDVPPVVQELYPGNGYQAPTLTPLLWARAVDSDAPPGATLSFKFEVCDRSDAGVLSNCTNSGYVTKPSWVVPAGRLSWAKSYVWRAYVKDVANEVRSPDSVLVTSVPQPDLLSRIAGSPDAERGREFDAQVGNYTTAAIDATVATVGPELNLLRTYNSLDPRPSAAFGAGWSSRYDMKLTPDNDGSGSVVIRYPDGQEVRFGKNPDGTYAAPSGRVARLTVDSTKWQLLDRSGTVYQFSLLGKLTKISDKRSRSLVLTYDSMTGKLSKIQVSNSQTNTAGRALHFTWTGEHITTVRTDAVDGAQLAWTYTYTGDLLTRVCSPTDACTSYEYAAGSHYRTAVLDARPDSYYRLGEGEGTAAASDVAINLGKDAGTYRNVTLAQPGVVEGTTNTAASFNGTSSAVELPKGLVKKSRDASVELWFKIGLTQTGGPLLGYQDKALGTAATSGVPVLYTGTDGRLRGQFAGGTIAPITSTVAVNDNKWHHVVLSSMGTTQTLYLDGVKVGERTGQTIEHSLLTFNQVGAASATTPTSWPGWGSAVQRHFAGVIDEVAVYSRPLGPDTVGAHFRYAKPAAQQLTKVTLPSGRVASEVEYDTATDRVKEYTDDNGGTWKIGLPTIYGGDTDLRRSIQVLDPGNRPHLYEYDALAARLLRSGTPLGLEMREEDRPGEPTSPPSPAPTPTCTQPDPNDPAFCTIIPDNSGGPVFVRHPLDGMAIRTYSYNADGYQSRVTNEDGASVEMTYDGRGRLATRKNCRTAAQCFTSYYTYSATITDDLDPRVDLAVESRDGRSANATDTMYRTSFAYELDGQLSSQTNPDGSVVGHTYTNGGEIAVGGGTQPAGLLKSSTDARGKVTSHAYYSNGDLARVTEPSGLVTEFTYDTLGRRLTEKVVSDTYPNGVTTTYTYDKHSRVQTVTGPVTTEAISGTRHQSRSTNEYDADGNVTRTVVVDLLGGDPERSTSTEYDEYNRPVRVVDPEGKETSYGYDRFGNRTSMTDANDNRYDWAYTAQNKVAEVRLRDWRGDPAGAPDTGDYLVLHSYSYDFAGRLASDTDAMGRRLEYTYYRDDLLHKITMKDFRNPDNTKRDYVVEERTYDAAGNVTRKVEANGTRTSEFTYDRAGKLLTNVVDPSGLARTTTMSYDFNGNVTRTTTTGKASNIPWFVAAVTETVDFTYDDAGNLLTEKATAGSETRTTSYTYDRRGLRLTVTDPRGNATGADKAAFTTTFRYDELGRQVGATGPAVSAESNGAAPATVNAETASSFNSFGEQVAVRDPRGQVSRMEYDKLGRPVRTVAPSYLPPGVTEQITPETRSTYDGLGNVIEKIDPSGTTRFTYDQLNRLVTRDEPSSTNDDRAVSRYTYTRTGEVLSVTDPTGAVVESTYDDLDRQVSQTRVERRPVTQNLVTRMAYDDAGNLTSVTSPSGATTVNAYDTVGDIIRSTAPTGEATVFGYDYAGRQIRAADGLGRTVRTGYDLFGDRISDATLKADGTQLRSQTYDYDEAGKLISSTDPYQTVTRYEYDAAGRLVKQIEPVSATESITTSFGYDVAGNRTRYTDGRGNSTIYTYNSLGLTESAIEPPTAAHPAAADRTWTVGYDAEGNAVRLSAPGGVSRQRTFDAAGRLTGETGSGGETTTTARALGYDRAGRLTSVSGPGSNNTYTWNDRGRLLSTAGPSGTASFAYDADGNMTSRTDVTGTAAFGYVKGRLDSLTDSITGQQQKLTYDAAGEVKTVDYGGGRLRTFGYDDFGRVNSDTLKNAANAVVASVSYGFDINGHLTSKNTTGTAGAGNNTYTYDKAGRLTSWTGPAGTIAYEWDASGNRIRAGSKTATFDERNRLLSDGDYTYVYTARGTLRSRTSSGLSEQYSFDAFDRLTAAAGQTYGYDGLDRVVSRTGTTFTYAGLADDVVADGVEYFARGPGGELLATAHGATERLSLTDAHGDVVAAFDPANTALTALNDSTAYDPFGKKVSNVGNTGNLGFQGDWTDPATGQVDMGARWYSPGTGTFTSRDSVNYSSGDSILANRYTFGAGAPLDFIDPDGHWPSFLKRAGGAIANKWNSFTGSVSRGWNSFTGAVSRGWNSFTGAVSRGWHNAMDWGKRQWNRAASAFKTAKAWAGQQIDTVKRKAKEGYQALQDGRFKDWARQQARAAAHEFKVKVTQAAKTAQRNLVKFTKLPVVQALAKPLIATAKVVSPGIKFAANIVSVTTQAIKDPEKFRQQLLLTAAEKFAPLVEGATEVWDKATQFVEDHAAEITGIAVGAVVGIGCGAAIGWTGVGAVACGALAGAVGSAVTGYMNGKRGWDLAGETALGGLFGAVGGGLSSIAGQALGAGFRGLSGGLRSAGSKALGAGLDEARAIGGGMRDLARKAMGRCPNSFTGETRVLMADGSHKRIDQVRIGDKVLATDPTTGRTEERAVTALILGAGIKNLVEITVDTDGDKGDRTGLLTATDGHPFWVADQGRWMEAKDLEPGYTFETADHRPASVVTARHYNRSQQAYNLTVDGTHTYYVVAGDTPVLVHNCDLTDTARAAARNAPEDATMTAAARFRGTDLTEVGYSGPSSRPNYLEPEIENELQFGGQTFAGDAANCAEVRACNLLIANHGAAFEDLVGRPLSLADIEFVTVRSSTGIPEPACLSCQSVLVRAGATDRSR